MEVHALFRAAPFRALASALLRGAVAGAPTLGVGGRLAMAGFAASTGRATTFTVGGTLTVVAYGAIAGAVLGPLFLLVRRRLPAGLSGGLLFGALALLVMSPGIAPPWPRTFALFAPAFLAYGVLLARLWRHGAPVVTRAPRPGSASASDERAPARLTSPLHRTRK